MIRLPGSRLYGSALVTALLFWLGGSALAVSIITRTDIAPFYSVSEIMTAKRGAGLPTEVHGAPSESATLESILAPLRLPSRVGGGDLVPYEPGRRAVTRMVLLFNPDIPSARTACRDPAATGARRMGGRLEVFAVLCHGGRWFSQAHLRDGAVTAETDTGYAGSMMQLFLALMPSRDEVERDSGDNGRD
ncbi:MAG: hypothetical protein ACLFV8_13105 [Alphaproteobacteria bacterium]